MPAAFATIVVDLFYTTRLQLRLAYDLSVLYEKPVNMDDPEDLYSFLRVAFGVKAHEVLRGAVAKVAPEAVRQGVKAIFTGGRLQLVKSQIGRAHV